MNKLIQLTYIDLPEHIKLKYNKQICLVIDTCPSYRNTIYNPSLQNKYYDDIVHYYYNCINTIDASNLQNAKTQGYIGKLIYGTAEKTIKYTVALRNIIINDSKYSKFVEKINLEQVKEIGNRIIKEKDNKIWQEAMAEVEDVVLESELEAAAEIAATIVPLEPLLVVLIVGCIAYAGYKNGFFDNIIAGNSNNNSLPSTINQGNGSNGINETNGNNSNQNIDKPNKSDYNGNNNDTGSTKPSKGRPETTCVQEFDPVTLEPITNEKCSTVIRPSASNPNPESNGGGVDPPTLWDPSRPN